MIVADTSALMAILQGEPEGEVCMEVLEAAEARSISAATLAEALIVANRRGIGEVMSHLVDGLDFEVVPVSAAAARRVALAYEQWGKGVHAASLNLGDCFAYELAKSQDCPLLFVGEDFAKTDIVRA